MDKKWVYRFAELDEVEKYVGGSWDSVRGLLGGKGANLAEMVRIGVPVPDGFIITTEACNEYLSLGEQLPEGLWEQLLTSLKKIEASTGKSFGDPKNPLLLSCRSGAKFSMPGMMDTVLNIGMNDETVEGLIESTGDPKVAYDLYRRLIQMFGSVVMHIPDEKFEEIITRMRLKAGVKSDTELTADHWMAITEEFKNVFRFHTHHHFPTEPYAQLQMATEAVFMSWNGKRAIDYRNAAGISHDLGTAVNIVAMVYGNLGDDSGTGVALTRSGTTGEKHIEGDYLTNAQGEDVVAGIRMTKDLSDLAKEMPQVHAEFERVAVLLENHYRDMQDVEFTIEKGKLWMLQTRDGKRTSQAAVRIAVDMAEEGLISKEEALMRVTPELLDFFFHPQFDRQPTTGEAVGAKLLAKGLNVSPGAAVGVVALDADLAELWGKKEGKKVIMVRPETRPDDVHGMLAAQGIVTSRGGRTSHAALVARQFGKPAVVGVDDMDIDLTRRQITVGDKVIKEGDFISVDGTTGEVFLGEVPTRDPDVKDRWLLKLLSWADEYRTLGVWANSDYPVDASRAREYGAEGIGLCRTEHMFMEAERLPLVQKMILAEMEVQRSEAIKALLPYQREDFAGLFRVMDGLPVVIRLIDPPLHEFLPNQTALMKELADLKIQLQHAPNLEAIDDLLEQVRNKEHVLERVEVLREDNPMLGLRGVRLGNHFPELTRMQVRAIIEAACLVSRDGGDVRPEIMIPLTSHCNELKVQRQLLETEARKVMEEQGFEINYKFGTMIEIPRAALTADKLAEYAEFFSFGTNDLTQTTYAISRDDAESGFLIEYMVRGILPENPFETIDRDGVGELMRIAVDKGRKTNPDIKLGICGEHGGEAKSIALCHMLGLNYVSCSPFRVPLARLAAARAAIASKG
ncbi:pyruvate, phosphate dikinase [Desulforhopalus singaporensis]|uniref:Pyruvate, phosphate dikinase n=1 Tax=Desulforhopalus singaporensis TaxID=91360 RepID=A0A1H0U415_9BACT|nr:pyruvate, phosphate dikinase [Desulforhopalus singaporensis]SDP60718.1 pyruvate phosphate dikinase [Desulforhopalus singaporensis]